MQFDEYQQKFLDSNLKGSEVYILNAVPGSGKSTVIAEKCNRLILGGEKPESIVSVTFSNRAARDLNSKMKQGNKSSTVHSMMSTLLRNSGVQVKLINDWGRVLILREMVDKLGFVYDTKREQNDICYKIISMLSYFTINHSLTSPIDGFKINDFRQNSILRNKQFVDVYKWFDTFKRERNLWDYDDLISQRAVDSIDKNLLKDVKYSFWDEAQDQDELMYNLINQLFSHTAVVLIGDVHQRIYTFRYAFSYPMEEPEEFFKGKTIHKFELRKNYRSTANIVRTFNANRTLYDNMDAEPFLGDTKGSVSLINVDTNVDEGKVIAEKISELVRDFGYKYREISVLARKSSYIKSVLEPALISANINYRVVTPQYRKKIYEVPINRLYISMISACIYEDISYLYYVADLFDGIGQKYKEILLESYVQDTVDISNKKYRILTAVYNEIMGIYSYANTEGGLNAFFECIDTQISKYSFTNYTVRQAELAKKIFRNYAMLVREEDLTRPTSELLEIIIRDITEFNSSGEDEVILSTIFQYKGLEQKVVFLAENTYIGSLDSPDEGQICYVGLSRAKERLIVVDSNYIVDRNLYRMKSAFVPSWRKTKQLLTGVR